MPHVKTQTFRDDIDIGRVVKEMVEEGDGLVGCVVAFLGAVRSIADDGAKVEKLSYEAEEKAVEEKMFRVCEEVASKYGVIGIRAYHKIGDAYAKRSTMCLFVSSKHKKEAFNALTELVDRMKYELPIQKKEYTDKGTRVIKG
ncbi:MAG: molybdenum cofactor biosynthesis protein MoaE [Candidatus Methanomethylicota archaeon]|uniref:Molybdenum cofactor biosynthesis protein MoaE n=1 Tax=Thermoproteota archaeon TaxID=2056631 RepID=A0A497F2Y6_9CREN|nr:MAG: molybdenum cofactor biosynthesis protein MoaE [Candidatus Verstraetearchaeota archaeon]RLE53701.1 MAG: molybdenum cofactor biosynthesis protein MoaE [Candidatus Verstraetearchaeota archaeon]